ncbi:hypothetical protein ACG7TL_000143 [Trametes sanguinea]
MSDASAIADLSDASFQIPRAVGNTDDLLMADDTIDFFNSANDTLSTPVPSPKPRVLPPLTLAELTPRSKPAAAAPVPSSLLRPRPGVATPFKAVVSRELSAAISEDLSPFRHRDPSFQLPSSQAGGEDLLMSDDADDFLGQEEPSLDAVPRSAQSPLTLSQLTPGPSMHMRRVSSVSPERSPSPIPSRIPNVDRDRRTSVENVEEYSTVIHAIVPDAVSMNPTTSEPPHDSHVDQSPVARPADNGNIKEPQKTTLAAKQKKLPGGDKAKRKRSGGLADALLSFGQKLLANAASSEHYREGSTESGTGSTSTSGASTVASAQPPKDQQSDAMLSGPLVQKPVQDSNYLTLSQLSPRKPGIDGSVPLSTTRSGLTAEEQTPAEACHQQTSGPQVSELERPTSPMRSSIKRAGSPTNEPDAHRRKRSKKTSVPSAPTSSRECAPRRPALQPSRARNASAPASAAGAVRVRRVVSASASGANLQTKATVETRKPATPTSAKLPSVKPTRPVEFQFATSTRIDSRRTDLEKSGSCSGGSNGASLRRSKAPAVHPIPDFKALHAMQESLLAQRKAEITPVVPQPIPFQTEMRAHEREKFEEARRAREAELERQREERRRQQELEEEREIKELRKRAVPKANEVPEWYAFAPKKSKAGTGK